MLTLRHRAVPSTSLLRQRYDWRARLNADAPMMRASSSSDARLIASRSAPESGLHAAHEHVCLVIRRLGMIVGAARLRPPPCSTRLLKAAPVLDQEALQGHMTFISQLIFVIMV